MCAFLCVYVCVCVAPPLRCVSFLFLPAALSYNQSPLPHPVVVVVVVVIVQPPPSPFFHYYCHYDLYVNTCPCALVWLSLSPMIFFSYTYIRGSDHPSIPLSLSSSLLPSPSFPSPPLLFCTYPLWTVGACSRCLQIESEYGKQQ